MPTSGVEGGIARRSSRQKARRFQVVAVSVSLWHLETSPLLFRLEFARRVPPGEMMTLLFYNLDCSRVPVGSIIVVLEALSAEDTERNKEG